MGWVGVGLGGWLVCLYVLIYAALFGLFIFVGFVSALRMDGPILPGYP